MRRFVRILLWGGVAVVVLFIVAAIGLRAYLGTDSARQFAAKEIGQAIGGTVVVEQLDAGTSSTSLVLEIPLTPGANAKAAGMPDTPPPLFKGRISVNQSLLGLATGGMPQKVTVQDATLAIRLDEHGDPVDALPSPPDSGSGGSVTIPAIELKNATVHIIATGKPDFLIGGVNATLNPGDNGLTLLGSIDDPNWGKWTSCGEWAADGKTGSVTLSTDGKLAIQDERVRSIPMVPLEVWKQVGLNGGETPANVTIKHDATGWGWRVELEPARTTLKVPSIELNTEETSGKVVIDGTKVTLTEVVGHTAEGSVKTSGVLDFGPEPAKLQFDSSCQGLNVKKLPESWGLPKQFEGKLKGKAGLTVLIHESGKVEPLGSGSGILEDAKVFGFPAKLVEVKLQGDGERFRFDTLMGASIPTPPDDEDRSATLRRSVMDIPLTLLQTVAQQASPNSPTTVQANLKLDDVDLGELVERLKLTLPIRIAGKVNLNIAATIPVTDSANMMNYRIDGKMTLPTLQLDDLTLKSVEAEVTFREGVLRLKTLQADVPDPKRPDILGKIRGQAAFGIEPRTDLTAKLTLDTVPLGQIFEAIPSLEDTADGLISGGLTLRLPGDKITDITAAEADGELKSDAMTVLGRSVGKTEFVLQLRKGIAAIAKATTTVEGLPISGSASLALTDTMKFTAKLDTKPVDVVSIRKLVPEAALPFDITGKLGIAATATGTLSPIKYAVEGTANSTDMTIGTGHLGELAFNWGVTANGVTVTNLKANGYEGTVTGEVKIPFEQNGAFEVKLKDVDATAVTKDIPSLPLKLEGKLSGTVSGGIPATNPEAKLAAPAPIKVDIKAPVLRVQGLPTRRLTGEVMYKPGSLVYKLAGELLGGTFNLDGTYPLTEVPKSTEKLPPANANPATPKKNGPDGDVIPAALEEEEDVAGELKPGEPSGTFRLNRINLARLGEELRYEFLRPLSGYVSAAIEYRFDAPGELPTGTGKIEFVNVQWGKLLREPMSARIPVRLTPTGMEIRDLSVRLLGGDLSGRGRYFFSGSRGSYFNVTLNRATLDDLLHPFGITGCDAPLSITIRGSLGRYYRGSGVVALARGKVAGFEIAEVRLPFDWHVTPGSGGAITLRDMTAQAGGGRFTGKASMQWGLSSQLEVDMRFVNVSIRQFLGRIGGVSPGRATGRFELSGTNITSLNDLTGRVTADLGETTLGDAPIFRILSQYLSALRLQNPFERGELRASLAKGIFRIQRLSLDGAILDLFVSGTIALNGKLDLDILAHTNTLNVNAGAMRFLRMKVPAIGPIPFTVILEISRFLSNRVIRFSVNGSISQPAVQINPLGLLAEEAIRYFLGVYDVSRN